MYSRSFDEYFSVIDTSIADAPGGVYHQRMGLQPSQPHKPRSMSGYDSDNFTQRRSRHSGYGSGYESEGCRSDIGVYRHNMSMVSMNPGATSDVEVSTKRIQGRRATGQPSTFKPIPPHAKYETSETGSNGGRKPKGRTKESGRECIQGRVVCKEEVLNCDKKNRIEIRSRLPKQKVLDVKCKSNDSSQWISGSLSDVGKRVGTERALLTEKPREESPYGYPLPTHQSMLQSEEGLQSNTEARLSATPTTGCVPDTGQRSSVGERNSRELQASFTPHKSQKPIDTDQMRGTPNTPWGSKKSIDYNSNQVLSQTGDGKISRRTSTVGETTDGDKHKGMRSEGRDSAIYLYSKIITKNWFYRLKINSISHCCSVV